MTIIHVAVVKINIVLSLFDMNAVTETQAARSKPVEEAQVVKSKVCIM